jgi:glyceraldehyde 3-phosphate dehydrogenase
VVRIGINGFGRIGRAIVRIASDHPDLEVVVINELDPDIENFRYLLAYDSLYGRFGQVVAADVERRELRIGGRPVAFHSARAILDVPWEAHRVDVVIEATGVDANALAAHDLVRRGVPRVVITNAHRAVDTTVVMGVNDQAFDPARHRVVSTSICDANAIAPVLHELDREWGLEGVHVTTLHPWLSYQNLLDGPISSVASPGHAWSDYGLGRSSSLSLIPKDTTAGRATLAVLPQLEGKLEAISFRVPTHIVSASDLAVILRRDATPDAINDHFAAAARRAPRLFGFETEHLVSIDYRGTEQSSIIDGRRTRVINGRFAKLVTWYDNEWGYSNRVVDVVKLVAS